MRLLVLICILLSAPLRLPADDLHATWRWSELGQEEGLPAEVAFTVAIDVHGTIWAGTSAGVAWFDGYRFHTPPGGDVQRSVTRLWTLGDGRIAFRVGSRLYTGDRDGVGDSGIDDQISSMAHSPGEGDIALVDPGHVYRLTDAGLEELALPSGVARNQVLRVTTAGGSAWLRTSKGLYRRDHGEWILEITGHELNSLVVGHDGRRYGAVSLPIADRGLWTWVEGGQPEPVASSTADLIAHVAGAPDGRILAVYESGATLLYEPDHGWHNLDPVPEPLRDARFMVFRDDGDLVLASSRGVRIHHSSDSAWGRWMSPGGGARNRVDEILVTRSGDVWLGTDAGVEVRHTSGAVTFHDEIRGQPLRIITGLAEDDAGGIWVSSGASWDGAFRFHDGTWRFYGYEDGLTSSRVHRIHTDASGAVWFLGLNTSQGIFRGLPASIVTYAAGSFQTFAVEPTMGSGRIHSMAEAADGALWFSGSKGIARWHDDQWRHWDTDSGLSFNAVFVLAADTVGGVWFGDMNNGVGHVSVDGHISYQHASDGLVDDAVWDLDLSPDGVLWVATRGGLSSWKDSVWTRFDEQSGLESTELWPVVAHGDTILVGSAGQGTFLLNLQQANEHHPRVWFDPPLITEGKTILSWTALSFEGEIPPDRILTRSRVDGGLWGPWETTRVLSLEIDPGDHRLDVQAAGMSGTYNEDGFSLRFTVPPPYYLQPLFYIPVGMSTVAVILLGLFVIVRRERDRNALQRSESRYRAFFDQAPISLWEQDVTDVWTYLDELGIDDEQTLASHLHDNPTVAQACMARVRTLSVNDASLELCGYQDREDLIKDGYSVFAEAADEAANGFAALYAGRQRSSFETRIRTFDGEERDVVLSWSRVEDRAHVTRIVLSILDITDQRIALRAAEEASRAKSAFLANTSHEIRTPINAVMGMAQALQEESLSDRAADQVQTILQASQSLAEVIDDLLDLSKIEADQLEVVQHPFDPIEVLEATVATLRPRAESKGLVLRSTADADVPHDVEGDRVRLRQVLLNLLGNAVKFTEAGRVDVTMHAVTEADRIELHFEVRDTGIGIPPDQQQAIFDPFTQADSTVTRTHGGTGLGLSISRRLVEMMGGSIQVDSAVGMGSTFRFHVCVHPGSGRATPSTATAELADGASLPPLRILLAEDNDLNRKVAHALLRKDEHEIQEAINGQAALELFEQQPFDVVLMDMQMPMMDGLTATEKIREYEQSCGRRRTPIIAVTANAMQVDRQRCLDAGMDDFLAKPLRRESLRASLARWTLETPDSESLDNLSQSDRATEDAVLDSEPLEELRELEEAGDFRITDFIELFATSVPACLERAAAAKAGGDSDGLHREVHTIKGSAREVGALRLAARAEFWEKRLKEGDERDIETGFEELRELFSEARSHLAAWSQD